MLAAFVEFLGQKWIDVTNTERGCLRDPLDDALTRCGRTCPPPGAPDYRERPPYDPPKTYCGWCVRDYMRDTPQNGA
jgi:hypothetical protein